MNIYLTDEQFERLLERIESPPSPNPALIDALRRTKQWEGGKQEDKKIPCMFDGLDPNKPYWISCPCPKCTPMCNVA